MTQDFFHIGAEKLRELMSPKSAADALRQTILDGFDPADDFDKTRAVVDKEDNAKFLLLPAINPDYFGAKLITVAHINPSRGRDTVQGTYVLFSNTTYGPLFSIDGAELTNLRTPAVTMAAFKDFIEARDEDLKVAIFGSGVQARAHKEAIDDNFGQRNPSYTFISRNNPGDLDNWVEIGSEAAKKATKQAEVVVCSTSAHEAYLDIDEVRSDALVVALGAGNPNDRELTTNFMEKAQIILEGGDVTLQYGGDAARALQEGADLSHAVTLRDIITGDKSLHRESPIVFKTTGMPWLDLAVAGRIATQLGIK